MVLSPPSQTLVDLFIIWVKWNDWHNDYKSFKLSPVLLDMFVLKIPHNNTLFCKIIVIIVQNKLKSLIKKYFDWVDDNKLQIVLA